MFKEENPAKDIKMAETIIGPSVRVEGDFDSDHDIIIDGEVIGNIKTKSNLRIGRGAKIKAQIYAKNAYISGNVIGNVVVKEKLQITHEAKIKGNITANLLMVELGAKLNGTCKMVNDAAVLEPKQDASKQSK